MLFIFMTIKEITYGHKYIHVYFNKMATQTIQLQD